jgi:Insulinase (Peptidase family M16)
MTFSSEPLELSGVGRGRAGWVPNRLGLALLVALAVVCWLCCSALPLKAAEDGNLFNKVVEHKLGNGLKVLLLREPRAPIITLQLWYRVGSRNECLGKTGISHLCEHLMFKGTAK